MGNIEFDSKDLIRFIGLAHRNTYAAPAEVRALSRLQVPLLPGHKSYTFSNGDWTYYDIYAGEEWAPGREVVIFKERPVWAMSYQGMPKPGVDSNFLKNEAFPFLKNALMNADSNMPFRGPREFISNDFRYEFILDGNYKYFRGRESIQHKGLEVFFQHVMGELIQ